MKVFIISGMMLMFLLGMRLSDDLYKQRFKLIPPEEVVQEIAEPEPEPEPEVFLKYAPVLRGMNQYLTREELEEAERGFIFAVEDQGLDFFLVAMVILHESSGRPYVESNMDAVGFMQLLPTTAEEMGEDPYTIEGNMRAGAKYLKKLITEQGTVYDALIAYNAGSRRYRQWKSQGYVPLNPRKYAMNIIKGSE
ncbi:MAG: lytic transglycosylase domain-containing protein [Deltaproteobacteria bacterium]|nr:lytic transglycosylase domain-containing protein [Deltaproteobacteria bacterium]